ncbi:hypothetical protein C8J57DRAFT_1511852 [Mycena rebaudengoi]|nr:hypothetical protein C8J57DRAFT_1511852 [Mycena rebaudengoi]
MAIFTLVSQSLRTGEPMSQVLPHSILERLVYHYGRTLVSAVIIGHGIDVQQIKSLSYTCYASAVVVVYQLLVVGPFVTAVALASRAPGVLPYTITGQSTFQFNRPITLTWTSDATDPVLFQIDIDELLNSLESTDPYFVLQNVTTALGSATFTPNPILSVGWVMSFDIDETFDSIDAHDRTHRIAFSSTDSFTVYTTGSIEILAPATSSSSPPTTTT